MLSFKNGTVGGPHDGNIGEDQRDRKGTGDASGGYISRKMIDGKERFCLQRVENGKIRSRYIKAGEFDEISAMVERREEPGEECDTFRLMV